MNQQETQLTAHHLPLPEDVFNSFGKAKDFLTHTVDTLTQSTQQARESLTQTAGQAVNTVTAATDKAADTVVATSQQAKESLTTTTQKAVDTVTTVISDVKTITATAEQAKTSLGETIEQTKASLEQTAQAAGQLKTTTSEAIQTAISSSVSDWLQAHPTVLQLVQLLIWAINHPILSLVILVFVVAIALSLIKAIGRLIETASWSLLQAPFKLGMVLLRVSFQSLGNFSVTTKHLAVAKNSEIPVLQNSIYQHHKDKQQRLAEISTRLEAIQKEQNELLQEVSAILTSTRKAAMRGDNIKSG